MRARARLLFAAVIGAGALAAGAAAPEVARVAGTLGFALVSAAFLTGLLIVELSSVEAESATFALVMAAFLTLGTPAAIVVAAAGEIGSALRPPLPKAHRSAFNAAAHVLAAAATGLLFGALGLRPHGATLLMFVLAIPASLVYFTISSGLVGWGIAWSSGASPLAVWLGFKWLVPHYPALAIVGMVLAKGSESAGMLGVLVFCLPLVMSHYSVEVFVRRTRDQMTALEAANSRLEAMNTALTETLSSVVDARDLYLYRHSHQASGYTERIARRLALPEAEVQLAKQGALLHDIGKVGIPEGILRKPAALDDAERAIMNSHSEIGAEIVARTRELGPVAAIVRAHHERWDGKGYPDGLKGRAIPVAARILAVLEAFDAMISDRPYRKAMSKEEAVEEIRRCSGTQFDPTIVRAFMADIREEGTEWLVNSAADATVSGADLFLPKSLANAQAAKVLHLHNGHDHKGSHHDGETHDDEHRRVRFPARF